MSIVRTQAEALGVSRATVGNYRRALRAAGKRITLASLRAFRDSRQIGQKPDRQRQRQIRRMRDKRHMTWAEIGQAFGFSAERAFAIYHATYQGSP